MSVLQNPGWLRTDSPVKGNRQVQRSEYGDLTCLPHALALRPETISDWLFLARLLCCPARESVKVCWQQIFVSVDRLPARYSQRMPHDRTGNIQIHFKKNHSASDTAH